MDIPQKDIDEINSHVFNVNRGENIVKTLSEGNILTIYVMRGIIQMNSDVFNEAGLYILSDDINTTFFVGFEHGTHDVLTYVFDNKDTKYTKKFWKRLGAHRLNIIKCFKKVEASKKLKYTIDSHVAHHLRKYYNSLSPSEKLEVELDL